MVVYLVLTDTERGDFTAISYSKAPKNGPKAHPNKCPLRVGSSKDRPSPSPPPKGQRGDYIRVWCQWGGSAVSPDMWLLFWTRNTPWVDGRGRGQTPRRTPHGFRILGLGGSPRGQ